MAIISVVIATYRRDAQLAKSLASLSAQTFRDFEIILIDDNADTVWSRKVASIEAEFHNRHPQIPIHLLVNTGSHGPAAARNEGIRAAAGEYVTFLDDDDVYLPEKLERQYSAMCREVADFSITDLILYNEDEKPVDSRIRSFLKDEKQEDLAALHMMYHLTGTDVIMIRREYLFKIGLFGNADIGDEFYLMQKAISGGGKFCYVPGCDVKAYVHAPADGLSAGWRKIKGENDLYRFKKTFFPQFKRSVRRRIKMRHYAVLTYTYLRMKKPVKAFGSACMSAGASPCGLLRLLKERRA